MATKRRNIIIRISLLIILVAAVILLLFVNNSDDAPAKTSSKTATTASSTPVHTSDEAVQSAEMIYKDYLPLKAQIESEVGDNPNVEPAEVQIVRASKTSFTKNLYDSILTKYMTEYQATGTVTKDAVVCDAVSPTTSSVALLSKTKDTATVNVTLTLQDGTTKVIPVTIDLHTLKADKIDCNT